MSVSPAEGREDSDGGRKPSHQQAAIRHGAERVQHQQNSNHQRDRTRILECIRLDDRRVQSLLSGIRLCRSAGIDRKTAEAAA